MSYDVYLVADLGGPEPICIDGGWNCTSNLVPMWCAAGADLAAFHGRPAGDCTNLLADAIAVLEREPERFRAMNPPNGWGSYDLLLPHLRELLASFRRAPRAIVQVSR